MGQRSYMHTCILLKIDKAYLHKQVFLLLLSVMGTFCEIWYPESGIFSTFFFFKEHEWALSK